MSKQIGIHSVAVAFGRVDGGVEYVTTFYPRTGQVSISSYWPSGEQAGLESTTIDAFLDKLRTIRRYQGEESR